jgi:hypothetical protein
MLQAVRCLKRELQRGTRQIKNRIAEKTKERWQRTRMHGQFPRYFGKKLVDNEGSNQLPKFGDIK